MRTILIAEDDEDVILFLRLAHDRAGLGCDLQFARDGEQAIAYLSDPRRSPPRFVLLDVKMPKRNGHEVLDWIRSRPASAYLPVIMFSSSADPGDVERAYRAGANSYFVKSAQTWEWGEMLTVLVKHWMDYHVPAVPAGQAAHAIDESPAFQPVLPR